MGLWLKGIEEKERDDYILAGPRRRKVRIDQCPDKEEER